MTSATPVLLTLTLLRSPACIPASIAWATGRMPAVYTNERVHNVSERLAAARLLSWLQSGVTTDGYRDVVGRFGMDGGISVAMECAADSSGGIPYTRFYAYDSTGSCVTSVNLDNQGDTGLPRVCMNCHGGQVRFGLQDSLAQNETGPRVTGAHASSPLLSTALATSQCSGREEASPSRRSSRTLTKKRRSVISARWYFTPTSLLLALTSFTAGAAGEAPHGPRLRTLYNKAMGVRRAWGMRVGTSKTGCMSLSSGPSAVAATCRSTGCLSIPQTRSSRWASWFS
ncbi:MAG: hypothetical protein ACI855_005006 [Myxococcota bacterium]|jgi:hypothetical protein